MPQLPLTRSEIAASALLFAGALCIEGPTWFLLATSGTALGLLVLAGWTE
jgi:hypothetical protein